ncbi:MAG: hypothetical protein KGL48_06860 [Sphingomonadales bacterium]|nr:hypothetical protein [Sphingomonadales bacterium]MDE2569941.1 hypothetical protein [Sphingomonadales bacterium]
MALLVVFLLGVGNFAMHSAVMDSGHPLIGHMPWFYHALGGRFSMVVEFLVLIAALLFATSAGATAATIYVAYSLLNAVATWLILTGRV